MSNRKISIFATDHLNIRYAISVTVICWLAALLLDSVSMLEFLETKLGRRLEFQVRDMLGMSPELDPKLKIFIQDDPTVARQDNIELSPSEWRQILSVLGASGAKQVIVNKFFTSLPKDNTSDNESPDDFASIPPTSAMVFLYPETIVGRMPLDHESRQIFEVKGNELDSSFFRSLLLEPRIVFGPDKSLRSAFSSFGHHEYDSNGFILPFIKIDSQMMVPYLGMTAGKLKIAEKNIRINEALVPLDSQNRIIPNLMSKQKIFGKTYSMFPLMDYAKSGKKIPVVKPGDTVVILPQMFTGNTHWVDTPFGSMPSGFVLVSVVNSALKGEWLRPVGFRWGWIFLATVVGTIIASVIHLRLALSGIVFAGLGYVLLGAISFSTTSIVFPWFPSALCCLSAGLIVHSSRIHRYRRTTEALKMALGRSLPGSRLDDVINQSGVLLLKPVGKVVTVMFVDIVGYSNSVESRRPDDVFYDLKKILNELTGIVHSYGGVVDRILGDGILAFFGYQYDGGTSTRAHADVAVECALKMQRQNVRRSAALAGTGEPVHLLRIGLNTENVYFGNLGDNYMIDVTLIGRGVNFASRLESACIPNNILISAATKDLLTTVDLEGASTSKIFVPIKHLEEPVEAYDIDPFVDNVAIRLSAEEAHRVYHGHKRSDNRWPVPRELEISLESALADGDLVNFSQSGLGVLLNHFLGRGITTVFNLNSKVPAIDAEIETAGFRQIIGEIRWGRPLPSGRFIHGILIKNLLPHQKEQLNDLLRKHLKEGTEFSDIA